MTDKRTERLRGLAAKSNDGNLCGAALMAADIIDAQKDLITRLEASMASARNEALRDAAAEASYQASEENDYRPPMVDVTTAILALIEGDTNDPAV